MIDFVLNEDQRLLQDSAQSFLSGRAPVAHLRELRDSRIDAGFCTNLWTQFAEQGYSATLVPEGFGGLGLGVVEAGLIAEQLGRTLTPSPFLSTAVLSAWAISRAGSAQQQQAWLPRIAQSRAVVTLAVDEYPKHRPAALQTSAIREAGGFRIDGRKSFVIDAHVADMFIIATRTEADALTLFLVEAGRAGLSVERTSMTDAHNAGIVHLDGVIVESHAVLGTVNGGAELLEQILDVARVVVASQLLGVADESFSRTLSYLKQRKQFGRLIGEFQALQHRAATLYCDIELTRAIVLKALRAVDANPIGAQALVSQAKARAGWTAEKAVQEAVQLHGGMGMTDAFDIGLYMKRCRVLQELFGDAGFHADRVASLGGY